MALRLIKSYVNVFLYLAYFNYINCYNLMLSNYKRNPSPYLGGLGTSLNSYPEMYNPFMLGAESDPLLSGLAGKGFGMTMSPPFVVTTDDTQGPQKAYRCSRLPCYNEDVTTTVCACNFNTGKVVSFKNSCDVKKHNCRFDTMFKVILNEICPWEFQSRRNNMEMEFDYSDPNYYNNN